jgi:hypothetical protein
MGDPGVAACEQECGYQVHQLGRGVPAGVAVTPSGQTPEARPPESSHG